MLGSEAIKHHSSESKWENEQPKLFEIENVRRSLICLSDTREKGNQFVLVIKVAGIFPIFKS